MVKLRFFAGLTMPEIAKVMKISLATAERHWTYARTWLYAELADADGSAQIGKKLDAVEGFPRGYVALKVWPLWIALLIQHRRRPELPSWTTRRWSSPNGTARGS